MKWLCALLLLLAATQTARADERALVHVVRAGDTLASIARDYYDAIPQAEVLRAENGLPERVVLIPGMRLTIPVLRHHRVSQGESWQALAERFYGDAERVSVLLLANDASADAPLVPGAQLRVPYPLRHVVQADESLGSLATRYYGDRQKANLIRAFNGGRSRIERGQLVLIPLLDLTLSPRGAQRAASGDHPTAGDDALAFSLQRLSGYVRSGRFVEAIALGSQLLEQPLASAQEVGVQRELATSYVALGRADLATAAFAHALTAQPELTLDPEQHSPRVRGALEAAKHQQTPP